METCIKIRKPQSTFPPDIRRAEEKISLLLGSCPSVTSSLSEETNTNLIAHNNNGHPLKTSSLNEETKTNLIAHNNNGHPLKTYSSHTTANTNLIAHNDSGKINLYNSNYP